MSRFSLYRIQCDGCGTEIDERRCAEAEEQARSYNWLLKSKKHGDLCTRCRKEVKK